MSLKQVSVIVLNWNNQTTLFDCLSSLERQTYPNVEIIVVDNGSVDGSLETLRSEYSSKVTLIENRRNAGFAEGVNQGVRVSKGDYIALLNSDAVAAAEWLEELVPAIESSPRAGSVASKIYLSRSGQVLDNVGLVLSPDGQNRCKGRLEKDTGQYDQTTEALAPSGAAAFYRRTALEEVGLFDSLFFAYGEDMDVGLRLRYFGYTCVFAPRAIVDHDLSGSTGVYSPLKTFFVERNRMWIILKCFPLKNVIAAVGYTFLRYGYLLGGIVKKKGPSYQYSRENSAFSLFLTLLKCYGSTLIHIPYLLTQRRQLMSAAKHVHHLDALLNDFGISVKEAALSEVS